MPQSNHVPPHSNVLLVFVKAPVAGQVKTRLGAEIGMDAALKVYRKLVGGTVRIVDQGSPGYAAEWWCYPSRRRSSFRKWLGARRTYVCQKGVDLGARMERAFTRAFRMGAKRVVVIGTDCPNLTSGLLKKAFRALDRSEAVIGPSWDGGYYLLGLRRLIPGVFRRMPWSTESVFTETIRRFRRAGISPVRLKTLRDVDTVQDVRRFHALRRWAA